MTYYPQDAVGLNYISYPAGPSTVGATLTADASNNTKGAYTELTASSSFESNFAHITVRATITTAGRLYLFDIATGAGGAETVIVPNLQAEGTSSNSSVYGHGLYSLPLQIAASTRIAARCQAGLGSSSMTIILKAVAAGGVDGVSSYVNYGANTADSGATQIDPGGTADTKGSYTEITASTSAIIQFLLMMITFGHTNVSTAGWYIDLATGAGGGETVLIPDNPVYSATSSGINPDLQPRSYGYLTYIAASTRIAARASCSINTATDRLLDIGLVGGVAPSEPASGGGGSYGGFG